MKTDAPYLDTLNNTPFSAAHLTVAPSAFFLREANGNKDFQLDRYCQSQPNLVFISPEVHFTVLGSDYRA
jgi:hypothetical protein